MAEKRNPVSLAADRASETFCLAAERSEDSPSALGLQAHAGPSPELRPLRPHQERGVSELRQSLSSGHKRPMLQMPTGAGKTLTSAHIVAGALGKGKRVAFCVPRKTLVDQTVGEFEREGISAIGVMQAAHLRTDGRQPIQICSAQTLARRERPDVNLVIVDEAHEMHASVLRWMAECPNIPFVGLSATPWARGLGRHYDDLIVPTTTRELIDAGFLSDFVAFAPSDPDLSGVRTVAGDFQQDELADAMDKAEITGDIVREWLKRGENRPTIAFCVNRRHAKNVCERFLEAGVAAEYMDCDTPSGDDSYDPDPAGETRRDIFARFRTGQTTVICNVNVLTTGVDLDVRCVVDAQPTKSRILFVQKIGRGLRTAEGKDKCVIIDHAGNHLRLGRVTDIHQAHLDDGKKRDGSEKKKERIELLPKLCPECEAVLAYKARECSACGAKIIAVTEVHEAKGDLIEFGSRKSGRTESTITEKAIFHAQLRGFAAGKGYREGWVSHKFKERFGIWPNDPRISSGPALSPSIATRNWILSRQIAFAKRRRFG
jgi:superfamily II DNA or RNA helicase